MAYADTVLKRARENGGSGMSRKSRKEREPTSALNKHHCKVSVVMAYWLCSRNAAIQRLKRDGVLIPERDKFGNEYRIRLADWAAQLETTPEELYETLAEVWDTVL